VSETRCAAWIGVVVAVARLAVLPQAQAQPASPAHVVLDRPIVVGEAGRRIDELAGRAEAYGFSGQVLVEAAGRVVLHRAYGFADAARRRRMTLSTGVGVASISKQFTAACILGLGEAGRLSLDDTLAVFFDAVPAEKSAITVRQLLTHRSGLRSRYQEDFEPAHRREMLAGILDTPLAFPPDSQWQYSAANYNLLAAIVEHASGMAYADCVETTLLRPAGMQHSFVMHGGDPQRAVSRSYLGWEDRGSPVTWPRNWRNFGAGDLVSTAADLYRWDRALRGGRIFSLQTCKRYLSPLAPVEEGVDYGYGLFFHRDDDGRLMIEHGGDAALGFNGSFYRYPDEGFLVLITCNARTPAGQWLRHALGADIETILRGGEVSLPPAGRLPKAVDIAQLPGTYRLAAGDRLHILTDGAHLWLAPEGQGAVDLVLGANGDAAAAARRANEATRRLLQGLVVADSTAYLRALQEEGAPYFDDYWQEWQSLVEARGPLHAFEILGSVAGSRSVTTRSRLQFRTGCITMTYFWGDVGRGRLRGTFVESIAFRPAGTLTLARSSQGGFVGFDPFGSQVLEVRIDDDGALRFPSRNTTARRQGVIGWTPPFHDAAAAPKG
jgi:CubicO group peptidase (beta-lactamase class C family)